MRTFWSVKGGSGVTVVAAATALRDAARGRPTVLVDLCGDLPAALGLPEPTTPGLAEWTVTDLREVDAIGRLLVPVREQLLLLPRGRGPLRHDALDAALDSVGRRGEVVVDAGTTDPHHDGGPAGGARSYVVLRCCYLAARRFVSRELHADGLIAVVEPGRALDGRDLSAVTGVPLVAEVHVDPVVARAVDAGTLVRRPPRPLERALRGLG